jgi:hypothetical protein
MASIVDLLTPIANELVGPNSIIPWWAWTAGFIMIFWGLLGAHTMTQDAGEDDE